MPDECDKNCMAHKPLIITCKTNDYRLVSIRHGHTAGWARSSILSKHLQWETLKILPQCERPSRPSSSLLRTMKKLLRRLRPDANEEQGSRSTTKEIVSVAIAAGLASLEIERRRTTVASLPSYKTSRTAETDSVCISCLSCLYSHSKAEQLLKCLTLTSLQCTVLEVTSSRRGRGLQTPTVIMTSFGFHNSFRLIYPGREYIRSVTILDPRSVNQLQPSGIFRGSCSNPCLLNHKQ